VGVVLFGTTLLAAFLGGVVALLAPCCVSVMLPAYLATGFRHRGGVVPATLVFGAGVATVILPIGLGATALSSLLVTQHLWIFSVGGALMIAGGVAVLAGWKPHLPMPGGRAVKEGSFSSAYVLGAFSGAASACCAPVLAGVAILSGAAGSFPVALAVGGAYVAGMVAPLALVALAWDRRRERAVRLLTDRTVGLRLGRRQREMALGSAASGLLMVAMGLLSVVLAFHRSRHVQRGLADRAQRLAAAPQRQRPGCFVLDPGLDPCRGAGGRLRPAPPPRSPYQNDPRRECHAWRLRRRRRAHTHFRDRRGGPT
jgi:cytochrome c biogenesis protein CcdA